MCQSKYPHLLYYHHHIPINRLLCYLHIKQYKLMGQIQHVHNTNHLEQYNHYHHIHHHYLQMVHYHNLHQRLHSISYFHIISHKQKEHLYNYKEVLFGNFHNHLQYLYLHHHNLLLKLHFQLIFHLHKQVCNLMECLYKYILGLQHKQLNNHRQE